MANNPEYAKRAAENDPARPEQSVSAAAEGAAPRLQELLRELVSRKAIKHAVMAVENGDGSFRWYGAAGEAHPDGTPMRTDTPYFIASVTKLYIAALILKLHEQGKLAIDDLMSAYLPGELTRGLHRLNGADYTDAITVCHLLEHSSGLPEYLEHHPKNAKSLVDRLVEDGGSWSLEEVLQIVREEMTPYFAPQPLQAKRRKIRYADTNYQLLIRIIETVSGVSVRDAFTHMLFEPLGLRHTFHPEDAPSTSATSWMENRPLEPQAMAPFRDLYSTVSDQFRFMQALSSGEVFAEASTRALMMGHWNRFGFNISPLAPGWPIEYGLGMMRFRLPRLFSPLKPVPAVVGHTGATGSWLFHCPELDVTLCGTVDQVTAAAVPFQIVPKMLQLLAPVLGR